jgi:hypothetical protein
LPTTTESGENALSWCGARRAPASATLSRSFTFEAHRNLDASVRSTGFSDEMRPPSPVLPEIRQVKRPVHAGAHQLAESLVINAGGKPAADGTAFVMRGGHDSHSHRERQLGCPDI